MLKSYFKQFSNKYSKWKKEQTEWMEKIEQKKRELDAEMREFSDRKFTLERSKLSTLNSNGKLTKKK